MHKQICYLTLHSTKYISKPIMKKKISLDIQTLKVKSFTTENNKVKGGTIIPSLICTPDFTGDTCFTCGYSCGELTCGGGPC